MVWSWTLAAASVLALTCFAAYLALVAVNAKGEPAFTRDQKWQLSEDYPGGTFIDDRLYKWCAGQQWWGINARGDQWLIGGSCVRWR